MTGLGVGRAWLNHVCRSCKWVPRRGAYLAVVAMMVVASLAGCGRIRSHLPGAGHREPARGTTTISTAGIRFQAIVRGPSARRAKAVVLFLHGASYTSRIWDDRGILDHVVAAGYRVVAVDLPGSGGTPERATDDTPDQAPDGAIGAGSLISEGTVLRELIRSVGGPARVVLVSPSASGNYSLAYLAQYGTDPPAGFVAVAPVGIPAFRRPATAVPIPALLVWGADDDVIPFANATLLHDQLPGRIERISGAGHAVYDDHPRQFEAALLTFLRTLHR